MHLSKGRFRNQSGRSQLCTETSLVIGSWSWPIHGHIKSSYLGCFLIHTRDVPCAHLPVVQPHGCTYMTNPHQGHGQRKTGEFFWTCSKCCFHPCDKLLNFLTLQSAWSGCPSRQLAFEAIQTPSIYQIPSLNISVCFPRTIDLHQADVDWVGCLRLCISEQSTPALHLPIRLTSI